jgi:short-subunit dehydrogenase
LAWELARQGCDLVLVARRQERLQEAAGEIKSLGRRAIMVAGDLCDERVRAQAVKAAVDQFGGLDFLINNAGVCALGPFTTASRQRLHTIFSINFFALVELTRLAIPHLRQGRRPIIVNVGSILSHIGIPNASEYCASKFAVRGFTESLRAELLSEGIDVLLVSPATTETEIWDRMIETTGPTAWRAKRGATPQFVARKIAAAMRSGKRELFPGLPPKLVHLGRSLFPGLAAWIAAWKQRTLPKELPPEP